MRTIHVFLGVLTAMAFAGMFAAASNAATAGDLVIPALIGVCFGASLTLLLFGSKRRS